MPLYETLTQAGRQYIRMRAFALAELDIQTNGPILRNKAELTARAQYHIEQIKQTKPTAETVITDNLEAFTLILSESYEQAYEALMVGYTGLQEPYRLHATPRYITSVNFADGENEHSFCGRAELLKLLKETQDRYRAEEQEPLSLIQVSIFDQANLQPHRYFIAYEINGDHLIGVVEQSPDLEDWLLGLGLPLATDFENKQIVSS
jgi:hypothetical protein